MYSYFICFSSLLHPLFLFFLRLLSLLFFLPSPLPFLSLSPLLGEGLSSSRLSLHKPGSSSVSNLPQRRESRVSVLLNHLLPSSSSNTGHSLGTSSFTTAQNSPTSIRCSSQSTGLGPQGIPEVVVSPPEDDDPLNSTEEEAGTPQFRRRASSASQGLELLALEGKYLCSLPVWVTAWTENTSTSMKALLSVNFQPSNPAAISSITHSKADLLQCFSHCIYPQSFWH